MAIAAPSLIAIAPETSALSAALRACAVIAPNVLAALLSVIPFGVSFNVLKPAEPVTPS